jgi:uncharacterized protein (DUF58 family)
MPEFAFGDREIGTCQRLVYTSRIATASDASGGHRIRRSGEGADFLDYRRYVVGDDVRRIDWTVFARLRQPYIRILQHETVLHVNLLVDVSRSMAAGSPQSKAALACRLACALTYVALTNGDRVTVATFSDRLGHMLANLRGRAALKRIVTLLRSVPLRGTTDLPASVDTFCERAKHRGLVIILSDFLAPGGYQEPIRRLLAKRFRVFAIQIFDQLDWGEGVRGPLRLRDSETRRTTDVLASDRYLNEYRRRLREHAERLDAFCTHRGQFYLYASTRDDYAQLVTRGLRERGLLR